MRKAKEKEFYRFMKDKELVKKVNTKEEILNSIYLKLIIEMTY